jgi:ADP-heptose:LPS heptosyltransferase
MRRVIKTDSLIGDLLMLTPAIRKLSTEKPEDRIAYWAPLKDKGAHVAGTHVLFQGNPYLSNLFVENSYDPQDDDEIIETNCMGAYLWGCAHSKTISQGLGMQLGVEIGDGPEELAYDYRSTIHEEIAAQELAQGLGKGRPIVIVARHSASCSSNDPGIRTPNKCISNAIWVAVANWLLKEGYMPVAVGSEREARDIRFRHWPESAARLYGRPLREIAALLAEAAGVLTIDTGIRHLAAAAGGRMYCVSGTIPLTHIRCAPSYEGAVFEEHTPVAQVTPEQVIAGAQQILSARIGPGVFYK